MRCFRVLAHHRPCSSTARPVKQSLQPVISHESQVVLLDGTHLPCKTMGDSSLPSLVWGHGLGPEEPWNTSCTSCEGFEFISKAFHQLPEAKPLPLKAVLYDARGHGRSSGWQSSAVGGCIDQFHWRSLAIDMVLVASAHAGAPCQLASQTPSPAVCQPLTPAACQTDPNKGVVLGGYSMGASSALWAAHLCPTTVRGLVLLSVTTAWEIRESRRGSLIEIADRLEKQQRPEYAACVRGAAFADLPSLKAVQEAQIRAPALLCAARDDPTHPAEVVERLAGVLPGASVLIADTTEELLEVFPGALQEWMHTHFGK